MQKNKYEILVERAKELKTVKIFKDVKEEAEEKSFFVFIVGNKTFAIEMETIIEVREFEHPIPVPNSPKDILGILNIRGQIIAIVDIQDFLDSDEPFENFKDSKVIIIQTNHFLSGFLTRFIVERVSIESENMQITEIAKQNNKYFKGFIFWNEQHIPVVDIVTLLSENSLML
jgi:purine-binding chemotaxis protein CheW